MSRPDSVRSSGPSRQRLSLLIVCIVVEATLHAQDLQKRAAFDVASVRANTSVETASVGGALQPGGRFIVINSPLRQIIRVAFQQPVTGGPSWIDSMRFDITANAGAEAKPQQAWAMLRVLLEDRFRLRVHEERQEVPAYALVLARADGSLGPGMRRAEFDCAAAAQSGDRSAFEPQGGQAPRCGMQIGRSRLSGGAVSLGLLSGALSKLTGRPVVNRTELDGAFDVQLSWAPESARGAGPSVEPSVSSDASIFTAVREQLGLELKSERGEVNAIVVDNVELPSPD